MGMSLTGRTRVRPKVQLFGPVLMVLQVEWSGYGHENIGGRIESIDRQYWRDATLEDITVMKGRIAGRSDDEA